MATEAAVLQNLNQNTACDFLGGQTPAQFVASLKQQRKAKNIIDQSYLAIAPFLTDAEPRSDSERL
jgi:hypothetical protein